MSNINTLGFTGGDTLIWNNKNKVLTQTQIPFTDHPNKNLPNFIIGLSGQSNSQGIGTSYDPGNPDDQPDPRIFGWNPTVQDWQIADLNTESLGWNYQTFKPSGSQCLAFHFAKRLVESNPNIRPGIINFGVSGTSIAFWAKWKPGDKWYSWNETVVSWYEGSICFPDRHTRNTGYIYDTHLSQIDAALQKLNPVNRFVNVICWHQGEADSTPNGYLYDSLNLVISQYYNDFANKGYLDKNRFGFIAGSTTGAFSITNPSVNKQLDIINHDSKPYTKEVDCTDLEYNQTVYPNGYIDSIHYSSNSQRILGRRYFNAYRSIFFNYY